MSESAGRKILIVEDYEETRLMMRLELEQCGYCIVEAADGEEAVRLAWRECPDIILMDLTMPEMDDADQAMEGRVESLCYLVRGQDACSLVTITYTNLLTRSLLRANLNSS
jgi:CheY-like chemotaxis protein